MHIVSCFAGNDVECDGAGHHEAMQEMFRHQPGQPPIVLHGRIDESEIQSIGVTSCGMICVCE